MTIDNTYVVFEDDNGEELNVSIFELIYGGVPKSLKYKRNLELKDQEVRAVKSPPTRKVVDIVRSAMQYNGFASEYEVRQFCKDHNINQ